MKEVGMAMDMTVSIMETSRWTTFIYCVSVSLKAALWLCLLPFFLLSYLLSPFHNSFLFPFSTLPSSSLSNRSPLNSKVYIFFSSLLWYHVKLLLSQKKLARDYVCRIQYHFLYGRYKIKVFLQLRLSYPYPTMQNCQSY